MKFNFVNSELSVEDCDGLFMSTAVKMLQHQAFAESAAKRFGKEAFLHQGKGRPKYYFTKLSEYFHPTLPQHSIIRTYLKQWLHMAPELYETSEPGTMRKKRSDQADSLKEMLRDAAANGELESLRHADPDVITWVRHTKSKIESLFRETLAFQEKQWEEVSSLLAGTILHITQLLQSFLWPERREAHNKSSENGVTVSGIATAGIAELSQCLSHAAVRTITDAEVLTQLCNIVRKMQKMHIKCYNNFSEEIATILHNARNVLDMDLPMLLMTPYQERGMYLMGSQLRNIQSTQEQKELPPFPEGEVIVAAPEWDDEGRRLFLYGNSTQSHSVVALQTPSVHPANTSHFSGFDESKPAFVVEGSCYSLVDQNGSVYPSLVRRLNPVQEEEGEKIEDRSVVEILQSTETVLRASGMRVFDTYPQLRFMLREIGPLSIILDAESVTVLCPAMHASAMHQALHGDGRMLNTNEVDTLLTRMRVSVSAPLAGVRMVYEKEPPVDIPNTVVTENGGREWRAKIRRIFPKQGLSFSSLQKVLSRMDVSLEKKGKGSHQSFVHGEKNYIISSTLFERANQTIETGIMITIVETLGISGERFYDEACREIGRSE